MSLGSYLAGVLGLAVVCGSAAVAAVILRRRLLPGWNHAPARLAELVLWVSVLTVELQLLGVAGLLEPVPIVVLSVAVAAAAVRFGRVDEATGAAPPAPAVPAGLVWLGLACAVAVAARWATGVEYSWAHGMNHFDSLWYHGPFAARFEQTGSIWELHYTDTEYLNWFYPQNSELQHALGKVFFGRDLASPLLNMGWLAMALLAAWSVGRPYGAGPISMIAVGAILCTNTMVPREPGNAATDIAPIALILAAAAVLLNATAAGGLTRGALIVGGLAAGLALGTKLTVAAAVAALTVGVAVLERSRDWVRSTAVWTAAVAATGGIWFLRNLVHGGNPVPWMKELGPISLPSPDRGLEGRDPFALSHYLLPPDGDVIAEVLQPALLDSLGEAWAAMLALAVAGMALAVARGNSGTIRMLGAVAVVAAIAYVFTPLTASGPEGTAAGFRINLRYAVPALALGLALLPLDRLMASRGVRISLAVAIMVPLLASVLLTANDGVLGDGTSLLLAVALGLTGVAVCVGVALAAERSPRQALAGALAAVTVAAAAVWFLQDDYFRERYEEGVGYGLGPAVQYVDELSGERIAVSGTAGAFLQYGFYGSDLSNHVQYIGERRARGDYAAFESCEAWREAVNSGDYDYLVMTGNIDLNRPTRLFESKTFPFAQGDPAAVPVLRDILVAVYELRGELDPAGCPADAEAGGP